MQLTELSPDVIEVLPHPDFTLTLTFENGEKKKFDMTPYLGNSVWFEELRDWNYFSQILCAPCIFDGRFRRIIGNDRTGEREGHADVLRRRSRRFALGVDFEIAEIKRLTWSVKLKFAAEQFLYHLFLQ